MRLRSLVALRAAHNLLRRPFAGRAADGDYTPTGPVVADNGFRPGTDGFPFANYGATTGILDIGTNEMRALYGDAVCATTAGGSCKLSPPAQKWRDELNNALAGGHCYGFSVVSLMLFKQQFTAAQARVLGQGRSPAFAFRLRGNARLQRELAKAWATQIFPAVKRRAVTGAPSKVVTGLIAALNDKANPETYTLTIFQRNGEGGHAITPYAVEDRGAGRYAILVYDNNWPGITRPLEVDTRRETWSYSASINPGAPESRYDGDKRTKTLALEPTTPGIGVQPCPFCRRSRSQAGATAAATAPATVDISLSGPADDHAHLLIRDRRNRRLGYLGKRFVNQIPGAQVIRPVSADLYRDDPEPLYRVPAGVAGSLLITIDGRAQRKTQTQSMSVIGPGTVAAVEDIRLAPGQRNIVRIADGGLRLSYQTDRRQTQSPVVVLGRDGASADDLFVAKTLQAEGGSQLNFLLDERRGMLRFGTRGTRRTGTYVLLYATYSKRRSQAWGAGFLVGAGSRATLRYRERITQAGSTGPPVVSRSGGRRQVFVLDPTKVPG
jgi:hypothetical protein